MDKNKIIEGAAKLVAKGSYDKAIKEYQKVLEADPKDIRVLQKMGELYQKKNDNSQAAHYFTKVAESYSSDGFFLKAVALYKQVLKLNPNLIDVNLKLAELHQQLGLMSEAMAYFQIVANHYDKSGDTKSSLETLKKMVDLDPENVASRIKLAELFARENMNGEALPEFKRAAEYLKRHNRTDDYLRVAERITAIEPENVALSRELASSYLSKGDQKRALAKLQICFKAEPKDIETLNLLAQAFQGLGQTAKTVSVYKELAKVYEERNKHNDAEAVWRKVSDLDPSDPDVQARNQARAPAAAPPPPSRPAPAAASPAPPPPPSSSAAPPPPPPGGKEQLPKLLTETDVYVKYGLHDKALEHLRKIFAIDPENLDAHEKAYHIYVAAGQHAQSGEQLLNVLRLCTRRNELQRAQPYLSTILEQNPGHPEVPAFLSVLRGSGAAAAAPAEEAVADDAILVDSADEEILVADAPEDALARNPDELALVTASPADSDEVVEDENPFDEAPVVAPAEDEPLVDAPLAAGADEDLVADPMPFPEGDEELVSEDRTQIFMLPPEPGTDAAALAAASASVEDETTDEGTIPPAEPSFDDEPLAPSDSDSTRVMMIPEGLGDEPKTTFNPAATQAAIASAPAARRAPSLGEEPRTSIGAPPPPPPAARKTESVVTRAPEPPRRTESVVARAPEAPRKTESVVARAPEPPRPAAKAPPPAAKPAPAPAAKPAPAAAKKAAPPPPPPPEEEPGAEECDEAAFFLEQGEYEEAREILETVAIAYPGHARAAELLAKLEELEASKPAEEPADEEPSTPAAPPMVAPVGDEEEGKDAFDLAAELAGELGDLGEADASAESAAGDDFQYSVDEVFAEFKKGLEKVVKPEDVDTHYDLGIAYKEMGLVDDAIGEFGVARDGCRGKKKEVDCLTMIGMLRSMKGDPEGAVEAFKEALGSEHAVGEVSKALRYELGMAYEATGTLGKALFHFQQVQKLDPKYREVAEKVAALAGKTKPDEDKIAAAAPPLAKTGTGGAPPAAAAARRKVGYV